MSQEVFKEVLIFIKIIKLARLLVGFKEKLGFLSRVVVFVGVDLSKEFEEVRIDIPGLAGSFDGFVF